MSDTDDTERDVATIRRELDRAEAEEAVQSIPRPDRWPGPAPDEVQPEHPWIAPHLRSQLSPAKSDPWLAGRLVERPPWHSFATPEAVTAAWQRLLDVIGKLDEATEGFDRLDADKADEVARQARAGEMGKKVPSSSDWAAISAERSGRLKAAQDGTRTARAQYDRAVVDAMPEWLPQLSEASQETWRELAEATAKTAELWDRLRAAQDGLTTAAATVRGDNAWRPVHHRSDQIADVQRGLSAAASLTASDLPVLSGAWVADDDAVPGFVREYFRDSTANRHMYALAILEGVEHREGKPVTDYTRGLRQQFAAQYAELSLADAVEYAHASI